MALRMVRRVSRPLDNHNTLDQDELILRASITTPRCRGMLTSNPQHSEGNFVNMTRIVFFQGFSRDRVVEGNILSRLSEFAAAVRVGPETLTGK